MQDEEGYKPGAEVRSCAEAAHPSMNEPLIVAGFLSLTSFALSQDAHALRHSQTAAEPKPLSSVSLAADGDWLGWRQLDYYSTCPCLWKGVACKVSTV